MVRIFDSGHFDSAHFCPRLKLKKLAILRAAPFAARRTSTSESCKIPTVEILRLPSSDSLMTTTRGWFCADREPSQGSAGILPASVPFIRSPRRARLLRRAVVAPQRSRSRTDGLRRPSLQTAISRKPTEHIPPRSPSPCAMLSTVQFNRYYRAASAVRK
jgi:hypothetical protein